MIDNVDCAPVFIVGAPRSGTTLLAQILSRHPDIIIFNETALYDFLSLHENEESHEVTLLLSKYLAERVDIRITGNKESSKDFGLLFTADECKAIKNDLDEYVKNINTECTYQQLFIYFMESIARHKGKRRYGEKTPNHAFHLDKIISDFPTAKIINVVRDPRDFVRSYKYAWRMKGSRDPGGVKKLYHPLVTANLWMRSDNAFNRFSKQHVETCHDVRYEDLVERPEETIIRICHFIGEEFTPDMVKVRGSNTSFSSKREELARWERAVCDFVCRKQIRYYDYEQGETGVYIVWAFIRSILTLPGFIIGVIPVLRRYYKGGIWKYLRTRGLLGR